MMTRFDPAIHGFSFTNTFATQPLFDIRFGGLCGGMSYAALDYFNAGQAIPRQRYRPANGSELFAYIKNRQGTSLERNVDKWLELGFNPFGSRTSEFFNWGIQGFNGGRLQELRTEIDAGRPVALGLFAAGDGGFSSHHHQVIAIGYDLGRYTGDLGTYKEDLRIFICDPNYPHQTMVLRPHPELNRYVYDGLPSVSWLTYFVDRKYSTAAPPIVTYPPNSGGGLVDSLLLEISTGGDDLRGGNDNVSATVNFRSRPSEQFPNLNKSQRWIGSYTETVQIGLSSPVGIEEISSVVFTTAFGGGLGGDNWNVDCIQICAVVGDSAIEIFKAMGSPLVRFTGSTHTFEATTFRTRQLWHTVNNSTSWTAFGDVAARVGGLSPFADISCTNVNGEMHICGPSFDGGLWHSIRKAAGNWLPFGNVKGQAGDPGHVVKVSIAGTGTDLHMCVVTMDGHLWHSLAHFQTGGWTPFADVERQAGEHGSFADVDCAVVNNELHVSGVTSDGGLWHSIRRANGSWTPFGDVKGQAGDRGRVVGVATDGAGTDLHMCIVTVDGHLWHTLAQPQTGRWTPFGDIEGQSGDRGSFVGVDCAYVGTGLHVSGVTSDGHLWHALAQQSGWTPFGDVEGQAGDRGTVVGVTCAGVAGELHLCALAAC
jgi:hypothetical protein